VEGESDAEAFASVAFDAELAALFALEAAAAVVAVTEFVARSGVRAEAAGTFLSAMCSSLG
jgi:hypothetical protein